MAVPAALSSGSRVGHDHGPVMVQVKLAEPGVAQVVGGGEADVVGPGTVGVPVMAPVAADRQPRGQAGGRPGEGGPGWVSVACWPAVVMALPAALDLLPGLATDTAPVIVQVKLAEPELPRLSVAVRVTLEVPATVGVPVMGPVALLSDSPVGSPVADQVRVVPGLGVGGAIGQRRDGGARGVAWLPGLVTATAPVTVQVKLAEPR